MNKKIFGVVFSLIISTVLMNDSEGAEITQYAATKTARFAGKETTTTPPFAVQGKWKLQWTSEGILGIILYETGTKKRIENTVLSMKGGTGSRDYAKAGTYYLKVTASNSWGIDIVELNPE